MMDKPFYRRALGTIMILTIIYLIHKVKFIFNPLETLVQILIVPFTISGFLYYLLRPIVQFLEVRKLNRMLSILLIYLLFAGLAALFLILVWPPLQKQIIDFGNNIPKLVTSLEAQFNAIRDNRFMSMLQTENTQLMEKITEYVNQGLKQASGYVSHIFTFLNDFFIVVGTVPIMLYYMLKEDQRVRPALLRTVPKTYRGEAHSVLSEIDGMLKGFIAGRMISAIVLAIMSFVGFWSIGLPYPLLLAIVGALFNFIPYFGALLGAIPCVIVAFTVSPTMVIGVIIIVVAAQQIEGNLVAPYIYGKTINIHPLTTIVLLLIAGDFAGILGMILAIPTYMVAKIVIVKIYRIYMDSKTEEISL
ncbi:AI-2E family transporter [Paenibacillus brevis]|uniref:AI-2E family transporter n=1 Tax=Paenibacillus brevis TaxID=2841508 RepID=A0ABS6FTS5_9BACL|nr:AI-2E family transporter [Paenibacillus brevis]MBU5672556.1 AI-2E family transporter [Paenibacillus brevis]